MGTEIERRWLLNEEQAQLVLPRATRMVRICQGYFYATPEVTIRVRYTEESADGVDLSKHTLTMKTGTGLVRGESEWPMTAAEGRRCLAACFKGLSKDRHTLGRKEITLDKIFRNGLSGPPLWLLEVEFSSENGASQYTPDFAYEREVTEDPGYTNAALSWPAKNSGTMPF